MRALGLTAPPGTYAAGAGGPAGPVVGRLVANTQFLAAVVRHGSFARHVFFAGEHRERDELRGLWDALGLDPARLEIRHHLDLPGALARREIDVLHLPSHVDAFADLVALRNRFAASAIPVTGQIHSLSYPRFMQSYWRTWLVGPAACDAMFCSSEAGRTAMTAAFAQAAATAHRTGLPDRALELQMPVVPLGIDTQALRGGDRARLRSAMGVSPEAIVVLSIGRFTEYDKTDLFPVLQAFAEAAQASRARGAELHLLLAGSRQGTRTPEMVELWARALGVRERVHLHVDFPEEDKRDLLAAADLFLSASDNVQETFGLSVIEAMAAGLPVVVSDFDGYKDTVSDDVGIRIPTRWLFDLEALAPLTPFLYERPLHLFLGQSVEIDLGALAAALVELASDPERRRRLGEAARARAQSRYDWRHVIPQVEAQWRALAAAPYEAGPRQAAAVDFGMSFRALFGHYTSGTLDEARLLRRSRAADLFCAGPKNGYVVYPELRGAVEDAEVLALLRAAEAPVTAGALRELARSLARAAGREPWKGDFTVGWLIKHGLLVDAS